MISNGMTCSAIADELVTAVKNWESQTNKSDTESFVIDGVMFNFETVDPDFDKQHRIAYEFGHHYHVTASYQGRRSQRYFFGIVLMADTRQRVHDLLSQVGTIRLFQ